MTTEIFSAKDFEQALPKHNITGLPIFAEYESEFGERVWKSRDIVPFVKISIRSSIRSGNEFCDETGENSIRVFLQVGEKQLKFKRRFYITRVPGWQERLMPLIRKYWKIGLKINDAQVTACECGEPLGMWINEQKEKVYAKCFKCDKMHFDF